MLTVVQSTMFADGATGSPPTAPPSSIVIFDTFNGAPQPLVGHQPNVDTVGGGWQSVNGDWQIGRGRAFDVLGYSTPYFTTINPNASNYKVSIDVTWFGASDAGLIFRYVDESNYYSAVFTGRHFELRKTVAGRTAAIKRTPINWNPFETKTIAVKVDDTSITATVENKTLQILDTRHEFARNVGAIVQRTANDEFKNFEVRALGPPVSPESIVLPALIDSVIFDSFTDATDPISLSAHAPEKAPSGSAWIEHDGTWTVTGGIAEETTGSSSADLRATIDAGIADVDIYTNLTWNGGRAGVVYRYVDNDNWWMTWTDGNLLLTASLDSTDGFIMRSIVPFDWGPAGTTRPLRVRINGFGIRVYADYSDIPRVRVVSDLRLGSTRVGLFNRQSPGNEFKEFVVAPSPALPVPDVLPVPEPPDVEGTAPATPPGLVLYDSFSDFPNTWNPFHDPDLAPEFRTWRNNSGNWLADFEQLTEVTGEKSDQRAIIDTGVEDSLITSKIVWRSGRIGIAFRYRDENNWAMAWYDGLSDVIFGKIIEGEFIEVDRFPVNVIAGRTYKLTAWIVDDTANVTFGNTHLGSFDVSELPASTFVGMFSRNVQPARFDNIAVAAPAIQPNPGGITLAPVVVDSFTEVGIVDIGPPHEPDLGPLGSTWVERTGDWVIDNGVVRETLAFNADFRTTIAGTAGDQRVSVDITYNGGIAGITYRYLDELNWYMFWYDGVNLVFGKVVAGVFSLVEVQQIDWGPPGTTRTLAVDVVGDTMTGYVDGTDVIFVTGENQLSGEDDAGLFARNTSTTTFDNFSIESITP